MTPLGGFLRIYAFMVCGTHLRFVAYLGALSDFLTVIITRDFGCLWCPVLYYGTVPGYKLVQKKKKKKIGKISCYLALYLRTSRQIEEAR